MGWPFCRVWQNRVHVSHRENQKTCCYGNSWILKRQTLAAFLRWACLEMLVVDIIWFWTWQNIWARNLSRAIECSLHGTCDTTSGKDMIWTHLIYARKCPGRSVKVLSQDDIIWCTEESKQHLCNLRNLKLASCFHKTVFIFKQQLDCSVNTELALDKSDYCKIMTISKLADLLLLHVQCWQGLQKLEMEKTTHFMDR